MILKYEGLIKQFQYLFVSNKLHLFLFQILLYYVYIYISTNTNLLLKSCFTLINHKLFYFIGNVLYKYYLILLYVML